jgi:hypothetical protein
MWRRHAQQQQCGAQMPARDHKARRPGEAPDVATRDREAQEHDRADLDVSGAAAQPGDYPASPIENRDQDNTPSAPDEPRAGWDDVVQPERQRRGQGFDRLPLPEGK